MKYGYARKLAHVAWTVSSGWVVRVICTSFRYIRVPIQIVSGRMRFQVQTSGEFPISAELRVGDGRVDSDESLLMEDIVLGTDEYEVNKILDVRSGRKTRYGRTAERCCGILIDIG